MSGDQVVAGPTGAFNRILVKETNSYPEPRKETGARLRKAADDACLRAGRSSISALMMHLDQPASVHLSNFAGLPAPKPLIS